MGLNKPITVGVGLTAAEVQSIIDAQTTAIAGKVDAQTNTLKNDLPSSISGGASISDINAALDEKLPQYSNCAVVKSKQIVEMAEIHAGTFQNLFIDAYNLGNFPELTNAVRVSGSITALQLYMKRSVFSDQSACLSYVKEKLYELGGYGKLTPVNKAHSLIYSELYGWLDNRDFDSGNISRNGITLNVLDWMTATSGGEPVFLLKVDITNGVNAEKIMCLEFN